ncbi:hypothetical protein ILUMI_22478 [Ignelater luminosus]|uniref:Uncharacterized protein n=1 Tax=Ignelater luminosus TaxID=2038154 RepID=A0A8K0FXE2_IGNLU|nr:hypothetical protein ILUMI_22478 [Ignelater luminosus]
MDASVTTYTFAEANNIEHPFNKQFGDEDFAPSLVTDVCLEGFTDNVLETTLVEEPPQPGCVEDTRKARQVFYLQQDIRRYHHRERFTSFSIAARIEEENNKATIKALEFIPLPYRKQKQNRCESKFQKSDILSSTPFKDELETCVQERNCKKDAKKLKAVKQFKKNTSDALPSYNAVLKVKEDCYSGDLNKTEFKADAHLETS